MAVFIQIPAILTIILLSLAMLVILPVFWTVCYQNSFWSSNSTSFAIQSIAQDQATCKNEIPIIFMAFVGAIAACVVWAFASVGKNDQNFG